MASRARQMTERRRGLLMAGLPILAALVVFGVVFAVRSSASPEFSHSITLMAQNDGRLGGFPQRNQAIAALGTDHRDVRVEPRFSTLIDVVATADTQTAATSLAQDTATAMINERMANTDARFFAVIDAATASLADLEKDIEQATTTIASEVDPVVARDQQRELDGMIDTANGFRRQILNVETDLAAAVDALVTASSTPGGQTAPSPLRDAALAAVAVAMAALLVTNLVPDPTEPG